MTGILLIFTLLTAGFTSYHQGIGTILLYSLLLISFLLFSLFVYTALESEKQLKLKQEKISIENKQLKDYITASWDASQMMIHEEKIMAIKFMMVGISHEINTPLGNALTSISILENLLAKNKIYNKDIQSAVDLSQNSIRRTIDLLGKFKEVAQITLVEDLISFNLKTHLNRIKKVKDQEWKNKSIKQHIICSNELSLNSYPHSLSVILGIFLENAYESIPGDEGLIEINCEQHDKDILLTLKDTGSGIRPENMEHIFDPFFTTTRGKNHMGLGLSIAHNIVVNLFKGEIKVESEWKKGTTIRITLPDVLNHAKVDLNKGE